MILMSYLDSLNILWKAISSGNIQAVCEQIWVVSEAHRGVSVTFKSLSSTNVDLQVV